MRLGHVRVFLTHKRAAYVVCSPPPSAEGHRIWVVIPAKRARLKRDRASRDPVIYGRRECTNVVDYWIPALTRRAKPGSFGRNDRQTCCGSTLDCSHLSRM